MKGQGSAEYLVLLAAILILTIVAIVLLSGFTSFGAGLFSTTPNTYWSGQARPLAVLESIQLNSTLYLKVKNVENTRIVLNSFTAGNTTISYGVNGVTFAPSAIKTIQVSGLRQCNNQNYNTFAYNLSFNYSTSDLPNQIEIGTRMLEGECRE